GAGAGPVNRRRPVRLGARGPGGKLLYAFVEGRLGFLKKTGARLRHTQTNERLRRLRLQFEGPAIGRDRIQVQLIASFKQTEHQMYRRRPSEARRGIARESKPRAVAPGSSELGAPFE